MPAKRDIGQEILEGLNEIKAWKHDYYVPFDVADYVDNPVALARINADITQEELSKRMKVTQAYISKIERQDRVTAKLLKEVKIALSK